jgi:hypothetical protein
MDELKQSVQLRSRTKDPLIYKFKLQFIQQYVEWCKQRGFVLFKGDLPQQSAPDIKRRGSKKEDYKTSKDEVPSSEAMKRGRDKRSNVKLLKL